MGVAPRNKRGGSPKFELRLDDATRERWQAAADVEKVALGTWIKEACEQVLALGPKEPPVFRTRSGKVLTEADIQALADEAERGYDLKDFKPQFPMNPDLRSSSAFKGPDPKPGGKKK